MATLFVVYKDGDPKKGEKHTRANCSDLVNGAGYTWKPNQQTTPAALSPHRVVTPVDPKEPTQRVLDAHGHDPNRSAIPGGVEEVGGADEEADDGADDAAADSDGVSGAGEPDVEDASTDKPRRGRKPKTA